MRNSSEDERATWSTPGRVAWGEETAADVTEEAMDLVIKLVVSSRAVSWLWQGTWWKQLTEERYILAHSFYILAHGFREVAGHHSGEYTAAGVCGRAPHTAARPGSRDHRPEVGIGFLVISD